MDRAFSIQTDVPPDDLYAVVADLSTYPHWMDLVAQAESTETVDDESAAWIVVLKARVGPLSRAKRLRMTQTEYDGRRVRFERRETDGRDHSPWVLTATVTPIEDEARSDLTIDLYYGGSMWSRPMEAILGNAAEKAPANLYSFLAAKNS